MQSDLLQINTAWKRDSAFGKYFETGLAAKPGRRVLIHKPPNRFQEHGWLDRLGDPCVNGDRLIVRKLTGVFAGGDG